MWAAATRRQPTCTFTVYCSTNDEVGRGGGPESDQSNEYIVITLKLVFSFLSQLELALTPRASRRNFCFLAYVQNSLYLFSWHIFQRTFLTITPSNTRSFLIDYSGIQKSITPSVFLLQIPLQHHVWAVVSPGTTHAASTSGYCILQIVLAKILRIFVCVLATAARLQNVDFD